MEIQDYTDSEFKHALARNLRSLTRGKKSSKQPIAILLGGQSGAGKTTIHRIKQKEFRCVYDSKENTTSAADVLQELLFGEWSQVEKEMLRVGEKRLNELLEK
ncbi:TPA: zeta toxin family protein [Streptococcus pneumoniae]